MHVEEKQGKKRQTEKGKEIIARTERKNENETQKKKDSNDKKSKKNC